MSIELDDVLALNEEIASLIQAGVSVPLGLHAVDPDPQVAIGRINAALVDGVSKGESLAEAIDRLTPEWPRTYATVIKSGLECGDLSVVLKSVQRNAASVASMNRQATAAMVYPLVVITIASLLFVFYSFVVAPALVRFWQGMRLPTIGFVGYIATGTWWWSVAAPGFVLLTAASWWSWYRIRSQPSDSSATASWFERLPSMRAVAYDYGCAELAEMTADLTRHNLSLTDTLRVAADSVANPSLRAAVLQRIDGRTSAGTTASQLPPFLLWLFDQGTQSPGFTPLLEIAARSYRERADRHARRMRFAIPVIALLVVASLVTLLYALALFLPIVQIIHQLAV